VRAPSPNEFTQLLSMTPYAASAVGQITDGHLAATAVRERHRSSLCVALWYLTNANCRPGKYINRSLREASSVPPLVKPSTRRRAFSPAVGKNSLLCNPFRSSSVVRDAVARDSAEAQLSYSRVLQRGSKYENAPARYCRASRLTTWSLGLYRPSYEETMCAGYGRAARGSHKQCSRRENSELFRCPYDRQ
jgi:hypothetical protein